MDIKVISSTQHSPLEESILHHGAEAKLPNRCDSEGDNIVLFVADLKDGKLDSYKGTYVAYQKGNLVGQSKDGDKLWQAAGAYYGSSSLTVFKVPEKPEDVKNLRAYMDKAYCKLYPKD